VPVSQLGFLLVDIYVCVFVQLVGVWTAGV